MTKASIIMVCPVVDLKAALSDHERDVLRKVLFDGIQGIDAIHDRRWKRHMTRLLRSEPGEVTEFLNPRVRSLPFHRRWMAIERVFFDNQDNFATLKGFRTWLKAGAGLGHFERAGERLVFVPGSVSFEEASDDEFREFVKDAEAFLRSPRAMRRLWPHLRSEARAEMVETLLKSAEQREEHA
jgi:hypothetical protein